jgi:hypothetical protein
MGPKVRRKPTSEPHQLDVSLRLAFKTARLDAIKIPVDVDLRHHLKMVRRPHVAIRGLLRLPPDPGRDIPIHDHESRIASFDIPY